MTEPTRDAHGRTHASLERALHTYCKAWEDEKRKRVELEAEVASHTAYKLSLLDALGPGVEGRSVPDAIRALKAEVERLRAVMHEAAARCREIAGLTNGLTSEYARHTAIGLDAKATAAATQGTTGGASDA